MAAGLKMQKVEILNGLSKEQKEAVGLLSIGTFLEYFDLMLYVHMAVLLNELFFPKTDPFTASIIASTAFCATFVFRPLGALLFGYIGDTIGRRTTVIITTIMMACSCFIMANLPTYAQIGISASYLITICRILQSLSSMEEVVGAELYLTESTKPPIRYPVVTSINIFSALGATAALGIASFVVSYGLNWRLAFWAGTGIALIGFVARTALRETPEFVNAKLKLTDTLGELGADLKEVMKSRMWSEKVAKKTTLAYFLIQCARPVCFYFIYVYCNGVLTNTFGYSVDQIIKHVFLVSVVDFVGVLFLTYLSYRVYPLKIIKVKIAIFLVFVLCLPYLMSNLRTPLDLFLVQSFICLFCVDTAPAAAIFYIHFPIFKRFTYASFLYALSRAIVYIITSFGLVFLTYHLGHWGLLIIMLPMIFGFGFGILHFERLEKEAGNYL
jgi:MHS family proline/betaine transporter-like MFS transporter